MQPGPQHRIRVAVTTTLGHEGLERLCPSADLHWGSCDFLINPARGTTCDYWIVWAGCRERDWMRVAPENTLFIAGEPPMKKIYPRGFLAQFHRVVSTHADDPHPRVTTSMPGLNWHVGLDRGTNRYTIGHRELADLPRPVKSNSISVVCSNLTTTEGQRRRLAFLAVLKDALGPDLIHFGRGFTPIPDKLAAILPHRFHLVLENSQSQDYWTEKLSDAYLGWALPLYVGCPNLGDYFPAAGFVALDPDRPADALASIRALLGKPVDSQERDAVANCRELILQDYNPFTRFAHWATTFHRRDLPARACRATSHKAFRPFPRNWLHWIGTIRRHGVAWGRSARGNPGP